eukprot:4526686-Pleurochrysis_carterae.AAC.2
MHTLSRTHFRSQSLTRSRTPRLRSQSKQQSHRVLPRILALVLPLTLTPAIASIHASPVLTVKPVRAQTT